MITRRLLSELTWLRVGGPATIFTPSSCDALSDFLAATPGPIFPMGVGSNLIVRDGGLAGHVIRLGRGFNAIEIEGTRVRAGAAALDSHVARKAASHGLDLTFLRTIPGSIGGAVSMNAGCYGTYVSERLIEVTLVSRDGEKSTLGASEVGFAYRSSSLPRGSVIVDATFEAPRGDPAALDAKMAEALAKRAATQPVDERSAGSTFRNPSGASSTGQPGESQTLSAWKLIEEAGMRGARRGGAEMSRKHANFLLNTGGATATDLEGLGEEVRAKVLAHSGISLEWEVMRIGTTDPNGG